MYPRMPCNITVSAFSILLIDFHNLQFAVCLLSSVVAHKLLSGIASDSLVHLWN